MMQKESLISRFPGATTSLMVTMTMTNSRSTKMAGGRQGDGFYPHLKVIVYLISVPIFYSYSCTHRHKMLFFSLTTILSIYLSYTYKLI